MFQSQGLSEYESIEEVMIFALTVSIMKHRISRVLHKTAFNLKNGMWFFTLQKNKCVETHNIC